MSSPSIAPRTDHKGPPEFFTDYLQHSIGLCDLFVSVETSADPDFTCASARPAVARTGTLRHRGIEDGELDVRRLRRVLDISIRGRQAEVQGWCSWRTLVGAAACTGMVPGITGPYPSQTVGAAIGQPAGGPRSFAAGLVHDSVTEADVAGSDGILRTATRGGRDSELLASLGTARGALGLVTRVVLPLVPAGPFVLERRESFATPAEWFAAAAAATETRTHLGESFDLLDGAIAPGGLYLCSGRFLSGSEARDAARDLGSAGPALPSRHGPLAALIGPPAAIWRTRDYFFRLAPPEARPGRHLPPEPVSDVVSEDDFAALAPELQGRALSAARPGERVLPLAPARRPGRGFGVIVPSWIRR